MFHVWTVLPLLPVVLLLLAASWATTVHALHDALISNINKHFQGTFTPEAVVDVGANVGKFSTSLRKFFPQASILMVEASLHHDDTLKKVAETLGNADHRITVLSGNAGEKVQWFHSADNVEGTGNSMFRVSVAGYVTSFIPGRYD
jgi:hypothetical protein